MNPRMLRHVLLLAEEMSFSRAAERACLSQTAFSRSIQAAEAKAGFKLFDRSTRRVSPTPACLQLLPGMRQLVSAADALNEELRVLAGGTGGALRFGASLMAIDARVRGRLAGFQRQRPDVSISVEVAQWGLLQTGLESGRIELAISYPGRMAADTRFSVQPLPPIPASIFCRAGHPVLRQKKALTLRDLLRYPWASINFAPDIAEQLRQLAGVRQVSDLPLAMNCDNQSLLLATTRATDTLLFTWSSWLQASVAAGELLDLRPRLRHNMPAQMFELPCAIVTLANRTLSPTARSFLDWMQAPPVAARVRA